MPWNGYNFETRSCSPSASSRTTSSPRSTSRNSRRWPATPARPEEITRDIPNVSEEALKNLDEAGIVYIGAEVVAGDILVGKISPRAKADDPGREAAARDLRREGLRRARHQPARAARRAGTIVEVRVFNRHGVDKTSAPRRSSARDRTSRQDRDDEQAILDATSTRASRDADRQARAGRPEGFKKDQVLNRELIDEHPRSQWWTFALESDSAMSEIEAMRKQYDESKKSLESRFLDKVRNCSAATSCRPA